MLIDAYDKHWLDWLDAGEVGCEGSLYLLVDGAFVPGIHRRVKAVVSAECAPSLLFEALPSCSDATRDVSPFLVPFQPSNPRFHTVIAACSGWPMVSAIQTSENQSELTERLAAWCVVEVDGQRFNFRFPDTRRLPCIFESLSPQQKAEFMGPASRWSYIQRDGKWHDVAVPAIPSQIAGRPALDDRQFARLIGDSEADEIISVLAHQGYGATGLRSRQHAQVAIALRAASRTALEISEKVAWCEASLAEPLPSDASEVVRQFEKWFASARPNRVV